MLQRFLFLFIILFLVELYAFQAFKTLIKVKWVLQLYQVASLILLFYIVYSILQYDRSVGQTKKSLFVMGLLLVIYIPKMLLSTVLFIEDIFRVITGTINYFIDYNDNTSYLPNRRKFVSQIGLGLAAIPFLSILYGIFEGRYNYKVFKQKIFYPDLPEAFDGFTITHISDIHSGSFDNKEKIEYAIDLINQQKSDVLLFTGDIVNAKATEMHPWIESFNKLIEPKFGKYSILGNHDYGAYLKWNSQQQEEANFEAIKDLHKQINFKLLLNENVKLTKNNQEIAIVGVENWSKHFGKLGDVEKATQNLSSSDFKVLMTHDPSHWEEEVKNHNKNFQLTLSGHTHGMQFGIEIPGVFKWSLAQYVYKQWAGCYEHLGRFIYVNRGFGYHAYPGRVGIMPEITVLELKNSKKVV